MVTYQTSSLPKGFHPCPQCLEQIAAVFRAHDPNPIPGVFHVPITAKRNGRNGVVVAYSSVPDDPAFLGKIICRRWSISAQGHARRTERFPDGKHVALFLHRIVFVHFFGEVPEGLVIDHVDRHPLNNTLPNLRAVSPTINARNASRRKNNTSGYVGVSFHAQSGKWLARIHNDNGRMSLGSHETIESAAKAIKDARMKYHPEVVVCPDATSPAEALPLPPCRRTKPRA